MDATAVRVFAFCKLTVVSCGTPTVCAWHIQQPTLCHYPLPVVHLILSPTKLLLCNLIF